MFVEVDYLACCCPSFGCNNALCLLRIIVFGTTKSKLLHYVQFAAILDEVCGQMNQRCVSEVSQNRVFTLLFGLFCVSWKLHQGAGRIHEVRHRNSKANQRQQIESETINSLCRLRVSGQCFTSQNSQKKNKPFNDAWC